MDFEICRYENRIEGLGLECINPQNVYFKISTGEIRKIPLFRNFYKIEICKMIFF